MTPYRKTLKTYNFRYFSNIKGVKKYLTLGEHSDEISLKHRYNVLDKMLFKLRATLKIRSLQRCSRSITTFIFKRGTAIILFNSSLFLINICSD